MDYQMITVGTVIKRFLLGWAAAGGVLTVFSCVKATVKKEIYFWQFQPLGTRKI